MKNDLHALDEIINGKLVIPEKGDYVYITADISNPSEFIFIPFNSETLLNFSILTSFEEKQLLVPGRDDIPEPRMCAIADNKLFTKEDFTWVGSEERGCWAYYQGYE